MTTVAPTRSWIVALLVITGVGVGITLFAFPPDQTSFYPRCVFHVLTGLHCPGCGSTRAMHQLLHGNFLGALRCNALLVLLLPALIIGLVQNHRQGRSWWHRPLAGWTIASLLLGFALLRNIPIIPFSYLAP